MKIFKTIREFFWPLLEKKENKEAQNQQQANAPVQEIPDNNIDKVLEFMLKIYESEEDRKRSVESKSSIFISTISIVTTVIIGVTAIIVKESDFKTTICFIVFISFLLTIYMARAVWFSIKALERREYHLLSAKDLIVQDELNEFKKKLSLSISEKTKKNSVTINEKVNNMVLAQEYFKRAIVVIGIYSFVLLLFYISKSSIDFNSIIKSIIQGLNSINFNGWNSIILYSAVIVALCFSIKSNLRKNKQNK